jgi:hypothetical protein
LLLHTFFGSKELFCFSLAAKKSRKKRKRPQGILWRKIIAPLAKISGSATLHKQNFLTLAPLNFQRHKIQLRIFYIFAPYECIFYLFCFFIVIVCKLWITFVKMASKSHFLFVKFVLTGVLQWFKITLECNKVVQSG